MFYDAKKSGDNISYKTADGTGKTVALRIVYEIIERTMDKLGQYLLEADIEVNTYWANFDFTDEEIIANYHANGECEQYHSELKRTWILNASLWANLK